MALPGLLKIRRYGLRTFTSPSTTWLRCPTGMRTVSAQSEYVAAGATRIHAAITDHRIKAFVSITGVNFGRLIREGFSDFDPMAALEKMRKRRSAEAQGAERNVINYLPPSVEQGKKNGINDIDVLEATDYYKTPRGQKPNGATSGLSRSMAPLWAGTRFFMPKRFLPSPLRQIDPTRTKHSRGVRALGLLYAKFRIY